MPRPADTIAALATPAGTAALAVLRVSGPDTAALAAALGGAPPVPRAARHGDYRSRNGRLIDDVVFTFFRGPASYTGEDSLEISCHGNPFIAQKILEDLLARGCRAAEPGEFTQRAFLGGKMDLSQAEAVMDLIHARSEGALAAAQVLLRGGLGRRMAPLVDDLLGVLARVEAYIDFPDEDLPPEDRALVRASIHRIVLETNRLLATSHYGQLLRDGVKVVLAGAPNAGKSSLLNRLVGSERALVSPEPGTTRDFIEERVLIGPHCIRFIDTAGLNPEPGTIERLGIAKTKEKLEEADVVLLVVDLAEHAPAPLPYPQLAAVAPERVILVFNKCDLMERMGADPYPATWPRVRVSALTGMGIEALRERIVKTAEACRQDPVDLIAINVRHARALESARSCLQAADVRLEHDGPVELVASDLREVLAAFGEITGRIDNERMLDQLFATFCIGK